MCGVYYCIMHFDLGGFLFVPALYALFNYISPSTVVLG